MNIGVDIRSLMDSQRSGVGEYGHQLLDKIFVSIANSGESGILKSFLNTKDNQRIVFYLFYNSFKEIKHNLPKWNYSFVHYCGFRWPNKLLNLCLKFVRWPKLDKLIQAIFRPDLKQGLDHFIFLNQNFYALSHSVKKIIVVHDLSFEIFPECFSLKSRLWHKFVNLRKMALDADAIIAVSENTKLDLINLYKINSDKIRVIYPKIGNIEIRNSREGAGLGNYILFLGTIEPRKNVLGLLKAYELLHGGPKEKNFNLKVDFPDLWIAGKPGYKSKEVFKFWRSMRAKSKVKFLGYVDEDQKWELYAGARVFVYPSFYEGFGMPAAEAMSIGTPVITSLTSSMHEVVKENGILIDPNRVEDLTQAMRALIENVHDKIEI